MAERVMKYKNDGNEYRNKKIDITHARSYKQTNENKKTWTHTRTHKQYTYS